MFGKGNRFSITQILQSNRKREHFFHWAKTVFFVIIKKIWQYFTKNGSYLETEFKDNLLNLGRDKFYSPKIYVPFMLFSYLYLIQARWSSLMEADWMESSKIINCNLVRAKFYSPEIDVSFMLFSYYI